MKAKVKPEIIKELACFGDWFEEKSKQKWRVRIHHSDSEPTEVPFKDYLKHTLRMSFRGDFYPQKYIDIYKIYEEYWVDDNSVMDHYKDMKEIIKIYKDEYEEFLESL